MAHSPVVNPAPREVAGQASNEIGFRLPARSLVAPEVSFRDTPPSGNAPPTPRTLPDHNICRAKNSGFAAYPDYADCLVDSAHDCHHALHFGMRHFCRHPNRMEIARRTAEESPRAPGFGTSPMA